MTCIEDKDISGILDIGKQSRDNRQVEVRLKEAGLEFEGKYRDFLMQLKDMPWHAKSEKEERWRFFQAYPRHDEFLIELWEKTHPGIYDELIARLNRFDARCESDSGMASIAKTKMKKKEIDWVIFSEAIKKAVETYTGRSQKGIEYVFAACVGQLYKQMAGEEASKRAMEDKVAISMPKWKQREVCRLVKDIKKFFDKYPQNLKYAKPVREAAKYLMGQSKYGITEKDMEWVEKMVLGERAVSIESEKGEEEDRTWGDFIADTKDEYQALMDELISFSKNAEDNWKIIVAARSLKQQEICKMFFTKDILSVLKTDKKGQVYLEEPAGNFEAYEYFEPQGNFFYGKVFYKKYLERAFLEMPEDFFEVYYKVLRSGFNFSDELLEEIEGKNKVTIWRYRKEYRKCMTLLC